MATMKGKLIRLAKSVAPVPIKQFGPAGILASVNLPVKLCETISDILAYKNAIKELEIEAQRIDREATLCHQQVEAATRVALEALNQRREHIQGLLADASAELARTRIDRRKIADAIARLIAYMTMPDTSVENQKIAEVAIQELVKLQIEQMQHARVTFDGMVSAMQAAPNHSLNLQRALTVVEE